MENTQINQIIYHVNFANEGEINYYSFFPRSDQIVNSIANAGLAKRLVTILHSAINISTERSLPPNVNFANEGEINYYSNFMYFFFAEVVFIYRLFFR